MDIKMEIKQELEVSEVTSVNKTQYFYKDLAVETVKAAAIWFSDCTLDPKTEVKNETAFPDFCSEDEKPATKYKADTITWSNENRADLKTKIGKGYPNSKEFEMINYNNNYQVENKKKLLRLEKITAKAASCQDNIKDEINGAESPRFYTEPVIEGSAVFSEAENSEVIIFNTKNDSYDITKCENNISETFAAVEAIHLNHVDEFDNNSPACSLTQNDLIQQGSTGRSDISKKNKQTLARDNSNSECLKLRKCEICEKTFICLSELKKHKLIHDGIKPHKCGVCGKSFSHLSLLKRHNLIHDGVKPHKCDICGKSFTRLSHLQRHNLIHGIKPCTGEITRMSHLQRQNLILEGLKPHKCRVCDKGFIRLSHLKEHDLIHQGVKPHNCEICDKSFTQLSHLQRHNLIHKGVKPHKCEICEKSFTRLAHLQQHNLTHNGIRPHRCEICNKSFTRLAHLQRHNLTH